MTSTTTSGAVASKPEEAEPEAAQPEVSDTPEVDTPEDADEDLPGFGFGTLPPEPAGDLHTPKAPSNALGVVRGHGVTRPEAPPEPEAEPTPPEPELIPVTADGSAYVPKETKNVSEHPLYQLKVEVDAEGDPVLADGPQFVNQFTNPAFAKTVIPGPFQVMVCDLGTPDGLTEYNKLLSQREPMGAPRVQILKEESQFDKRSGNWKIFVMYRRISYRKVVT